MVLTDKDKKPCWGFNGNLDKPTVSPSINVKLGEGGICHSFVDNGYIRFLNDCTHELAGKTVEIPEWD